MSTRPSRDPVREIRKSDVEALSDLVRRVNEARRIIVIAGAGISTDGGMPVG
jgi:hypothetical protein